MLEYGALQCAARPRFGSFAFQGNPLANQLSLSDQAELMHLVTHFASSDDRNKRNLGLSTFVKHLGLIHSFVCRGDSSDALRGAICGIEFADHSFLINTGQLKKLMFRSKSCMNGCFQRLGYSVCKPIKDLGSVFAQIFPQFNTQLFTSRQWCVRRAGASSIVSFSPNVTLEIAIGTEKETQEVEKEVFHPLDINSLLNHPTDSHRRS
jgi:hypothetical protein